MRGCHPAVWRKWVWAFSLAVIPLGCGTKDAGPNPHGPATANSGATKAPAGPPLSDAECREFAEKVKKAFATQNTAALISLIDWDALIETATAGVEAPTEFRKAFAKGLKGSLNREQSLVGQIVARAKEGGSYTLLRIHDKNGRRCALFRLLPANDGGVNYHDFVLARSPTGQVRATDLYVFLSGELISQTFRRSYIPEAAYASRGFLAKLTKRSGPEKEFVDNAPKLQQMIKNLREQKFPAALEVFNSLPPRLKKDKTYLLIRLQAAQGVDEQTYAAAIEDFRSAYPSDACVDMMSMDYFFLKKQYAQAFECIDRLDRAVGGDPFLNLLRANAHVVEGKFDDAERDVRRTIEQEPTLQQGYDLMLVVSASKGNYDETLAMLKILSDKFHVQFGDLSTEEALAGFVKSPQHQQWLEYQKANRPAPASEPEAETGQ
jgi:hypothetical protein